AAASWYGNANPPSCKATLARRGEWESRCSPGPHRRRTSTALVGDSQADHGQGIGLDLGKKLPHIQPVFQIWLAVQRQDPEIVLVLAMALRRHRTTIAGLAKVGLAIGVVLATFRQRGDVGGNVVLHPVHETIGTVGRYQR